MATERLSMRQTREILRQKLFLERSHREVARSVGIGAGSVGDIVRPNRDPLRPVPPQKAPLQPHHARERSWRSCAASAVHLRGGYFRFRWRPGVAEGAPRPGTPLDEIAAEWIADIEADHDSSTLKKLKAVRRDALAAVLCVDRSHHHRSRR